MRYDKFQSRNEYRVTTIFEIKEEIDFSNIFPSENCIPSLRFGRLQQYINSADKVFPQIIRSVNFNSSISKLCERQVSGSVMLWKMPSNEYYFLTVTLNLPLKIERNGFYELINDIFEELHFLDHAKVIGINSSKNINRVKYQITYIPSGIADPREEEINKIIYRSDLPSKEDCLSNSFMSPYEINRRPNQGGVLSGLGAVLWGQQDYIENINLMSAIMAVSSLAVIRDIKINSLEILEEVSNMQILSRNLQESSIKIRAANEQVSRYVNLLAISTDAVRNLFNYIPSLRPNAFHDAIFELTEVDNMREQCERILNRVKIVVDGKQSEVDSFKSEHDFYRARRWIITVSLISTIAIPFSIVFGYFGMNSTEIDSEYSILDFGKYSYFYFSLLVGCLVVLVPHLISWILWRRGTFRQENEREKLAGLGSGSL